MKSTMPADLPQHQCPKPGYSRFAFAPLDFDVMKALVDRGASSEEVNAQVRAWIAAAAAKNPNPTEPEAERFRAALVSNTPFAIYCTLCLETICLIHPEQVEEDEIENEHEDDLERTTDKAAEARAMEHRDGLFSGMLRVGQ